MCKEKAAGAILLLVVAQNHSYGEWFKYPTGDKQEHSLGSSMVIISISLIWYAVDMENLH